MCSFLNHILSFFNDYAFLYLAGQWERMEAEAEKRWRENADFMRDLENVRAFYQSDTAAEVCPPLRMRLLAESHVSE